MLGWVASNSTSRAGLKWCLAAKKKSRPSGSLRSNTFILAVFLILGFGLWRLQVAGSEYYANLAERNRVRTVPILAPRGKILDREGRLIVDNYPSTSVLLLRDQSRDLNADVDKIAAGLHMDADEVRDRINRFKNTPQYQPLFLKDDITPGRTGVHRIASQ